MKLKEQDEYFALMQKLAIQVIKEQKHLVFDIKKPRDVFENARKNNYLTFKS